MSTQDLIGKVLKADAARDAIHIAVAPMVAACYLEPGQHIGILSDGIAGEVEDASDIGIVDPFLTHTIQKGERFFMFLYPNTITSLRHEWTHPSFAAEEEPLVKSHDERWIREFAARVGLRYEILMDGAKDFVASQERGGYGEFLCFGGLLEGEYVPDGFWPHYEAVTGTEVPEKFQGSFFTCSC